MPVLDKIRRILQFIRFSHTIFALPFAVGSMLVAARGLPDWPLALLILLAVGFARAAAVAVYRLAAWENESADPAPGRPPQAGYQTDGNITSRSFGGLLRCRLLVH